MRESMRECWRELRRDSLRSSSRWKRARRSNSIPPTPIRIRPLKTANPLRRASMAATPVTM